MTRLLQIAVGTANYDTHWKNKSVTWDGLKADLRNSVKTMESSSEYKRKTPKERNAIKDCGGFVGGSLRGGNRTSQNIISRSVLTIDIDEAPGTFWDDFVVWNDWACCLYSTHSYTPADPHFRLVAPLDRDCLPEEYEAVVRKVAEHVNEAIGKDIVDPASFKIAQEMYWPSHPSDIKPVYQEQDGTWINVDQILAEYADWKDHSQWLAAPKEKAAFNKMPEDPTAKDNIVGTFCRVYPISRAIETFLPDVYTPTATGRYTFINGQGYGGVQVTDDLFAFSNHSTDPANTGHQCNAFDLVRIHKFGDKDKNVKEGAEPSSYPSYKAMEDLALQDEEVRALWNKEIIQKAQEDMKDLPAVTDESDDWMTHLESGREGIKPTASNFVIIMEHDKNLRNIGGLDVFSQRLTCAGPLPWDAKRKNGDLWKDADDASLRIYIDQVYGINSKQKCDDALAAHFAGHQFDPVKDYLSALVWDGTKRVDTLLIDYMGAQDSEWTRMATRKMLCAAVARTFRPGCKFDYMLVLSGPQGCGKSTIIMKLSHGWWTDNVFTTQGKDASDQIQGVWLVEMAELSAMRKADAESNKQFISRPIDKYRMAYDRRRGEFPRRCVFFGTTNDDGYLKDPTGNRRYWPVECRVEDPKLSVWDDLTEEVVDQIWAEAVQMFRDGETIYPDAVMSAAAAEAQKAHEEDDSDVGLVQAYLERRLPLDWVRRNIDQRLRYLHGDTDAYGNDMSEVLPDDQTQERTKVCALEILCEEYRVPLERSGSFEAVQQKRKFNQIMANMPEWEKEKAPSWYGNIYAAQRGYVRKKCLTKTLQTGETCKEKMDSEW